MPIYNEDTERVAAGLDAILAGLAHSGMLDSFDVFVLSDTTKNPIGAREIEAIAALRAKYPGGPALFYRRRERNIGRKAGNIEDFVRRWGQQYAHMLVLDADSVMSGKTIVRLAQLMEGASGHRHHPDRAGAGQPRDAFRPHPAVREPALWAGHVVGALLLVGRQRQLLWP
jgi:membrane glycosyltransferase